MVPSIAISLGLVLASVEAYGAIDFTPHVETREFEGAHVSNLTFNDDKAVVAYQPPGGWGYRGEGNALTLWDPKKAQMEAKIISAKSVAHPVVMNDAQIKILRRSAQAALPPGNQNAKMVSEAVNAVMINGSPTYEATFTYAFFGQNFQASVLYGFLDNQILTVMMFAHAADFALEYKAFHASLYSLQWQKVKS